MESSKKLNAALGLSLDATFSVLIGGERGAISDISAMDRVNGGSPDEVRTDD